MQTRTLGTLLAGAAASFAVVIQPVAADASTDDAVQPRTERVSDHGRVKVMEEVIVTAQKRSERLQDVPVPATVVSADLLVQSSQLRIQDYFAAVPGLNIQTGNFGDSHVSIRGLTTGFSSGNPTVGLTVDDVPYGASYSYGSVYATMPDVDLSDLARVEVLRGPQGTLYGASTIGGLLKYVTIDPSTDGFSGRLQAGTSSIRNSDEVGYSMRGAINVPLGDTLAIRLSGFTRQDAGYIDDPALGKKNVNRVDAYGGRLSAMWKPSDVTSLKLSALLQNTQSDGTNFVDDAPDLGDLQHRQTIGAGKYENRAQAYSAVLTTKLSSVEFTSVTGYNVNYLNNTNEFVLGFLAPIFFGVDGSLIVNDIETKKFTQELRLSFSTGERFDWLLGAFYTDESSYVVQDWPVVDTVTGEVAGSFLHATWPTTYEEYAAFANLTVHVSDRFDVQIGGRKSENRQTYSEIDAGLYGSIFFNPPLADPVINPEQRTKDSSFTYLLTPQFKVSPDLMVYARLASGYRSGGPNPTATLFNVPIHFKPDKTESYEIGVKGSVADNAFAFDASIYYIDWKDIQILAFDPVAASSFFDNAGGAKSQGVELAVEARPFSELKIASWVAFNDAVLTDSFPSTSLIFGEPGDRLPSSSRWSGNFSVDREFLIGTEVTGSLGGSINYVGDRASFFKSGAGARQPNLPSYVRGDLRASLSVSSWEANIYVNNVADKRGVLQGDPFVDSRFIYIQPRTVGVSFTKTF